MEKRIALLSVYDKTDIIDFTKALIALNFDIIASGGTARALSEAGVKVTDVAEITGCGAILGHRVVTLHPSIHGGLMAREDQREELQKLGFPWIDLLCVDLYPLEEAINAPGATTESVIAQTDVGGPALLGSAAKGRRIVIADAKHRAKVLRWLKNGEHDREHAITTLCAAADGVVADYRLLSAKYHSKGMITGEVRLR